MSVTVGILPYSRFNKWLVDFGVSRVSQQLDATCKSLSRRFQHLSQQQTSSRTFGICSNHRRPVRWRSGARYISFIPKRHLTLTSGARLCSKDYFMHLKFQVMFGRIPLLKLHLIFLNPMFFKFNEKVWNAHSVPKSVAAQNVWPGEWTWVLDPQSSYLSNIHNPGKRNARNRIKQYCGATRWTSAQNFGCKKNRKLIHLSKCATIHQKLTCALADCAWNMSFFLRWHLLLFVLGSESVPLEKTQRKTAVLHVRIYCGLPWLIGVQDLHRISRRVQGISLETLNMETEVPFSFAMTQTFSLMIPSHKS